MDPENVSYQTPDLPTDPAIGSIWGELSSKACKVLSGMPICLLMSVMYALFVELTYKSSLYDQVWLVS